MVADNDRDGPSACVIIKDGGSVFQPDQNLDLKGADGYLVECRGGNVHFEPAPGRGLAEFRLGQRFRDTHRPNRVVFVRGADGGKIQYGDYANDRTYEADIDVFRNRFAVEN